MNECTVSKHPRKFVRIASEHVLACESLPLLPPFPVLFGTWHIHARAGSGNSREFRLFFRFEGNRLNFPKHRHRGETRRVLVSRQTTPAKCGWEERD